MPRARFRDYFLRGLAVVLPTVLTIWIFIWAYHFVNNTFSVPIKKGMVLALRLAGASAEALATHWIDSALSLAGFLIALGLVYIVGLVLASVFGKAIWRQTEGFLLRTPLLKQVYPHVKQITDFFFKQEESKAVFTRVVAVEYPRKGIWSMGLVTGTGLKKIVERTEKECLTVFMATTPSPLTGVVIIVPRDEAIELDMPIEEAFRFIVSAGLIAPGERI